MKIDLTPFRIISIALGIGLLFASGAWAQAQQVEPIEPEEIVHKYAIVVVGGSIVLPSFEYFRNAGELAYTTLRNAGFAEDDIIYLSPEIPALRVTMENAVDMKTTKPNITAAFDDLAYNKLSALSNPAQTAEIFVYFVGPARKGETHGGGGGGCYHGPADIVMPHWKGTPPAEGGGEGGRGGSGGGRGGWWGSLWVSGPSWGITPTLTNRYEFLFDVNDDGDYDDPYPEYLTDIQVRPLVRRLHGLFKQLVFVMDTGYSRHVEDDVIIPGEDNEGKIFIASANKNQTNAKPFKQFQYSPKVEICGTMFGYAFYTNLQSGSSVEVSFRTARDYVTAQTWSAQTPSMVDMAPKRDHSRDVTIGFSTAQAPNKKAVVVVGTDGTDPWGEYTHISIDNTGQYMASLLKAAGYHIDYFSWQQWTDPGFQGMTYQGPADYTLMDNFFNSYVLDPDDQVVFYFTSHGFFDVNHWKFQGNGPSHLISDTFFRDHIDSICYDHDNPALVIFEACDSGCLANPSFAYNLTAPNRIVLTAPLTFAPPNIPPYYLTTSYSWWVEWGCLGPPMAIFTHYLAYELFFNGYQVEPAFWIVQQQTWDEVLRLASLGLTSGNERQTPEMNDQYAGNFGL